MTNMEELLARLSNAHGISGYEGSIREILEEELSPYADEVYTDKVGNLIAIRNGKGPSVMLASHMDEIGLMVKYIDENGFIWFVKVGGWFDQTLLNQRVIIRTKKGSQVGIIGSKPPHIMTDEERKKLVKAEDMFIDIGAKSAGEAEKMGVRVGQPISLDRECKHLTRDRITGKAFDNRAGVAMMIEALRLTKTRHTVYAVGTVQEEVGLKGARTSAFGLEPDVAIATDVAIAGNHPGVEKKESSNDIGGGPVLTILDASGRGLIAPAQVIKWMEETANASKIKYQLSVSSGGTTDATAILLTRAGIPAGCIGIATRYIHTPVEVLSMKDLDLCARLIARCCETAGKYF